MILKKQKYVVIPNVFHFRSTRDTDSVAEKISRRIPNVLDQDQHSHREHQSINDGKFCQNKRDRSAYETSITEFDRSLQSTNDLQSQIEIKIIDDLFESTIVDIQPSQTPTHQNSNYTAGDQLSTQFESNKRPKVQKGTKEPKIYKREQRKRESLVKIFHDQLITQAKKHNHVRETSLNSTFVQSLWNLKLLLHTEQMFPLYLSEKQLEALTKLTDQFNHLASLCCDYEKRKSVLLSCNCFK